jgi:hypothetical protein
MWWGASSIVGLVLVAAPPQPGVSESPETAAPPAADTASQPERTERPAPAEPRTLAIPTRVQFDNQMGKRFRLVEATVLVDGREVAHRRAAAGEELESQFQAYQGTIAPGNHALMVDLVYEGRNVGPFNYLDNYRYRVDSSYAFTVRATGRPANLDVVARERKGVNLPPEKRPVVEITPAQGSGAFPSLPATEETGAGKTIVR